MEIEKIGHIVATEIHGMRSFQGETISVWGEFSKNPKDIPLSKLRKYLTKVSDIESFKPKNSIKIIAYLN